MPDLATLADVLGPAGVFFLTVIIWVVVENKYEKAND